MFTDLSECYRAHLLMKQSGKPRPMLAHEQSWYSGCPFYTQSCYYHLSPMSLFTSGMFLEHPTALCHNLLETRWLASNSDIDEVDEVKH